MELLIPGLLLVGFMVWASTRIKKNAAAAFEPETIETDEFIIQKPDGFLHNLNGDPKFIFEAYSKELSKVNDKFRIGTATILRIENSSLESVANEILQADESTDHGPEMIDDNRHRHIELLSTDDEIEKEILYKLAEKNGNVYKLEITAVKESANGQWIETFFDSFRVK